MLESWKATWAVVLVSQEAIKKKSEKQTIDECVLYSVFSIIT
jgi:hypothetical protein